MNNSFCNLLSFFNRPLQNLLFSFFSASMTPPLEPSKYGADAAVVNSGNIDRMVSSCNNRRGVEGMKYHHSMPIAKDQYEGKVPTVFRPRISVNAAVADDACWECRDILAGAGWGDVVANNVGCINPTSGNLNAACIPEALPDRLRIASLWVEYAFAHDGKLFNVTPRITHSAQSSSNTSIS